MGQIARQKRADRFIKEFEEDYVKKSEFHVGQELTVARIGIGCRNGGMEEVVEYIVLSDKDGKEYCVEGDGGIFFDPDDFYSRDDIIEPVSNGLDIGWEQAESRLKKADLID